MRDPCFRTALQGAVCQTIAWERKQGKDAEEGVGGRCLKKKKREEKSMDACVSVCVLLKRVCHVMAALAVFVFPVGCAGTGPRQSLPCPLSGRRQEAGEPSLIPAQQQRLQLSRAHGELLRQNAYVHLINLSPTLFVSQFLSLVSSSISAHRRTRATKYCTKNASC